MWLSWIQTHSACANKLSLRSSMLMHIVLTLWLMYSVHLLACFDQSLDSLVLRTFVASKRLSRLTGPTRFQLSSSRPLPKKCDSKTGSESKLLVSTTSLAVTSPSMIMSWTTALCSTWCPRNTTRPTYPPSTWVLPWVVDVNVMVLICLLVKC